mmetsp:Transcript_104082/g.238330  ORF Transcript_104082/g.238330 Transcript_104082/m.238330 type:complete len:250 (-) Transcript_104082:2-751(-)
MQHDVYIKALSDLHHPTPGSVSTVVLLRDRVDIVSAGHQHPDAVHLIRKCAKLPHSVQHVGLANSTEDHQILGGGLELVKEERPGLVRLKLLSQASRTFLGKLQLTDPQEASLTSAGVLACTGVLILRSNRNQVAGDLRSWCDFYEHNGGALRNLPNNRAKLHHYRRVRYQPFFEDLERLSQVSKFQARRLVHQNPLFQLWRLGGCAAAPGKQGVIFKANPRLRTLRSPHTGVGCNMGQDHITIGNTQT